ncbi:MAG: lytic transglycosylase domain-containing protein, partial [Rhodospirillales bacterium]
MLIAPLAQLAAQPTPPAKPPAAPVKKTPPAAVSNQVSKPPPATTTPGHRSLAGGVMSPAEAKNFQRAIAAADAARWGDAMEAANATNQPVAAKYVQWMYLRDTNGDAGFGTIAAFMNANPNWPDMATLRRRAEERLQLDTPLDQVARLYDKDGPITGDGGLRHLEALNGKLPADTFNAKLREYWITLELNPGHEQGFLDRYGAVLTKADHWARADRLLWQGNDGDARRILPLLDANYQYVAQARMALMAKAPDAENLIALVPQALQNEPGLLFERARWLRRMGRDGEATTLLLAIKGTGANGGPWWIERGYQARELIGQGRYDDAYKIAANHGGSSGAAFAEGEFLAGWIALRFLKRADLALPHFQTLYAGVSTPISRARGVYWTGRALDAAGKASEAAGMYRTAAQYGDTYYGQLAAKQLRQTQFTLPIDPAYTAAQRAAFEHNELVTLARLFHQVDEGKRARVFLLRLTLDAPDPATRRLAGDLALDMGRADIAIQVAKRSVESGTLLNEASFPVPDIKGNLVADKALVLALSRQESQFDVAIVSPAGAMGLMQLMPDTGKRVAKALNMPYAQGRLTSDATYNATLGSQYLADMLEKFGGTPELAMAAYNAGPNRVSRWLDQFGDPRGPSVDMIDWVELIPFRETRNYVQRVMEGVNVYRQKL